MNRPHYLRPGSPAGRPTRAKPSGERGASGSPTPWPSLAAVPGRRWGCLVARGLGALSVLAVGAVHLQQYLGLYSAIPTIGRLFVVNFAAATVIGLALLSPIGRLAGSRGRIAVTLVTLSGIALAAGSFVLLLVSEHTSLFGFHEPGYDPPAIAASRGAELGAVVLLGISLALRWAREPSGRR